MFPYRSDIYKRAIVGDIVLDIIQDEDYENPRVWESLGTMVCWHRNYTLGDKHDYSEPSNFLQELASELFGYEDVDFIKDKADKYMLNFKVVDTSTDEEEEYEIYEGDDLYDTCYSKDDVEKELQRTRENYIDEIYEDMSNNELLELIETKAVILPLYLYDHSGITMNTTGFSCGWDSGQVGYIYCTHDRFIKETGYTEDELFNTDIHREPKVNNHVKLKGYEDKYSYYGQVKSIENGFVTVDFDYNKITEYKKAENVITIKIDEVSEVMSNQAENMLIGEVETYDDYLTGNVYGFKLSKIDREGLNQYLTDEEMTEEDLSIDEFDDFLEEVDSCWGFFGDDIKENGIADHLSEEYQHLIDKLESVH